MPQNDPGRVRYRVLAALAAPALPMAALTLPLTIFLPAFYATTIGINLAVVGVIFTAVRLSDLVFDPLVGGLMDRTRTRWGRFKPWMAAGAPIIMIGAWRLFMAKPGVGGLYLATSLIIAYAGYSIIILSQMGISSGMTPDYKERSRVFAWWQVFNVIGLILVLVVPPLLTRWIPATSRSTVQFMGLSVMVTTPLTVLVALLVVRDNSRSTALQPARLFDYLSLFRLASVRLMLASVMSTGLALGVSAAVFVFFFVNLKGVPAGQFSLMLAAFYVVNVCAAPAWAWIGNRFGKHRALAFGGLGMMAYQILAAFMPHGAIPYLAGIFLLGGFCACSADILPRAMTADVSDEDRLHGGVDRTGMLYALLSVTQKLGQALAIGIVYVALDLIGYKAAADKANSDAALFCVLMLGSAAPAVLYFIGSAFAWAYPLTASRHEQIRSDLAEMPVGAVVSEA